MRNEENSWSVSFAPCDPLNPGFGYALRVEVNGTRVLYTSKHPVTGSDLDFDACLEVAAMYGPKRYSRPDPNPEATAYLDAAIERALERFAKRTP